MGISSFRKSPDCGRGRAHLAAALGAALCAFPSGGASAEGTLVCTVTGYDLILRNGGDAVLPAGTAFEWSVPFARAKGTAVTDRDLAPGAQFLMSAMLGASYLGPDKPCIITLTPP